MAEHYELKFQQSAKTLTAVRAGIQSIFNRLHCKTFGPPDMSAVSESNMTQYLGIIEARVAEIMQVHQAVQAQDGEEEDAPPPPRPAGGAQLLIKLPSTVEDYSDDEEEDDEDDQRPFTREELKLKTIRGIQKKQEKNKKSGRGRA